MALILSKKKSVPKFQIHLSDIEISRKKMKFIDDVNPLLGQIQNGMPELHGLTPLLGAIQDGGHAVMLVTDGRMSGASGRVPAAIHLTPEASDGGPIGKIRNGDILTLDANLGNLSVKQSLEGRSTVERPNFEGGFGRELFSDMRDQAASAEKGGGINLLRRYQ